MKHLRFSSTVIISLFAATAMAQGKPAPATPAAAPSSYSANAPAANAMDSEGFSIRGSLGPSYTSSRISSSGVSSTLPQTLGNLYGGAITYNPKGLNLGGYLQADSNSVKYSDLDSVTPNTVNFKQDVISFGLNVKPFMGTGSWERFFFGIGYFFEERSADTTNLMVANGAHINGPQAMIGTVDSLSGKFFYETDLTVAYPNAIVETPVKTGYYAAGMRSDFNFRVVFPYTDLMDFSLGVKVRYNSLSFVGDSGSTRVGGRGTPEATESGLMFALPFELRLKF